MSVFEDVIERLSAGATIKPTTKKSVDKIDNPSVRSVIDKRVIDLKGKNSEIFEVTSVRAGSTHKSKAHALASELMPYVPKFYSSSMGNEGARRRSSGVVKGFIQSCLKDFSFKEPVVIINNTTKTGEVSSTFIVTGDKTIVLTRSREKSEDYDKTKGVYEKINGLAINTEVFAEMQNNPDSLTSLKKNVANSTTERGPICEGLSCMIGSVRGRQVTPLAVQTTKLEYVIDDQGEVFVSQNGREFNASQEDGQTIEGTDRRFTSGDQNLNPNLITKLNGEDVIKTGCAIQIGRNGNFLSGNDTILSQAINQFECEASFITPVQQVATQVELPPEQ